MKTQVDYYAIFAHLKELAEKKGLQVSRFNQDKLDDKQKAFLEEKGVLAAYLPSSKTGYEFDEIAFKKRLRIDGKVAFLAHTIIYTSCYKDRSYVTYTKHGVAFSLGAHDDNVRQRIADLFVKWWGKLSRRYKRAETA